jgi:hypothetical protein
VIRQTITCDTCGMERKHANHWFEAFEHEGELRIRGLVPTKTTRPGLKHLCGQTCLHRLVDDFLAGNLSSRMFGAQPEAKAPIDFAQLAASVQDSPNLPDLLNTDLLDPDLLNFESSARLIETPPPQPHANPLPAAGKLPAARTQSPKAAPRAFAAPAQKAQGKTKARTRVATRIPPVPAKPVSIPPAQTPASAFRRASVPTPATQPPPPSHPSPGLPFRPAVSAPHAAPSAPVQLSASAPILDPPPSLTPQARRAQAWERERARKSLSPDRKPDKIQRFL